MLKKYIYAILIFLAVGIFLKSCIRADIPEPTVNKEKISTSQEGNMNLVVAEPKTVTINGVDYLQSQAPIGTFGGELVTSQIGEGPKTFNPWNSKDATSTSLSEIMFDGLVTTDPYSGDIQPKLAKSYTISPDGKTYVFNLRRGLKWSDGKSITADDVFFTYNTIIFEGFGNPSTRDAMVVDGELPKITKIDDYTVKFTTKKPFAPFLRQLATPIAPKHILEPVTRKGNSEFESFWGPNTKPEKFVTSGAFRLAEYVPAQRAIYKRNPNYYIINKKSQKLPYLDRYIVLIVGDLNNELLKFKSGEVDIIDVRGVNVPSFKKQEKGSDYVLYNLGPTQNTMFFTLNLNKRKNEKGKFYVQPQKQLWFNDRNFRSALDYAVDRENMIFNVANGVAKPLFTAESLSSLFLNEKIARGHSRDIEKARDYLKASKFHWDKKGNLYDRFGNRVEFDLFTNAGNTERESVGVMVKQDLADIGIKVNFKPIEFNSLVNRLTNTLDWDSAIIGLTGSPLEPHGGKNVWDSNGPLHIFNRRLRHEDDLLLWEKKLNNIYFQGALELDMDKRKALYDEYQQIVYDEKPIIYLYSPIRITAVRKKFQNTFPTPLGGVIHNLEEIYIKKP